MESKVLLSVIIISHNQKAVLKRCIDSVLGQVTSFPYEVIVSDDNSTDGTKEMLLDDYRDRVISVFVNTDIYETSYTLERAAYNRINGLKYASGRYLIHTDGDDFFTSSDIFELMVNTLELHPECNLCAQCFRMVNPNNLSEGHLLPVDRKLFKEKSILSGEDFIAKIGFLVNACFCMRHKNIDYNVLSGINYDDGDITMHFLGSGKVALVNRSDFVYVQYQNSSSATIPEKEKLIIFRNGIAAIKIVPNLAGVLLKKNIKGIVYIALRGLFGHGFSNRLLKYTRQFDIFVFSNLSNTIIVKDRIRYAFVIMVGLLVYLVPIKIKFIYRLLYKMSINWDAPSNVVL